MELMDGLCELENLSANHHEIMALAADRFANTTHHHQPQQHSQPPDPASMNFITNHSHDHIQSFSHSDDHVLTAAMSAEFGQQSQKEKAVGGGGRKRKRNNGDKDSDKPKEVIHVRAKRGQATDSHSLAERVRREKINDRLRCLQNLVPGCYKTMGMAVMLDVVISYVQSLQNQIEFLSMKLSAASVYYDFNSPGHTDAVETMQGTNVYEVQENMVRSSDQGYGGIGGGGGGGVGLSFNQSTSWPL